MRTLIRLFAGLYPRWWRARYGVEFGALLEDEGASAKVAWNVLLGAVGMLLRGPTESEVGLLLRNRGLLVVGSVFQAAIAAVYFLMQRPHWAYPFLGWKSTVTMLGSLELAAGVCAVVAGLRGWKNGRSWLLVANGAGFVGLGFIHLALMRYPVSILVVALLVAVMAASLGVLLLRMSRTLRVAFAVTGMASIGFVVMFVALGLRLIHVAPNSHVDLLWLGSYFAFSAVTLFGSASGVRGRVIE